MGDGWTCSSHPFGASVGLVSLNIMERKKLTENARGTVSHLQEQFKNSFENNLLVGKVRGIGLLLVLEFLVDKSKKS